MAQRGVKSARASFADAQTRLARTVEVPDPPPELARKIDGDDVPAGGWPGAPFDKLPPDCPVVPIGKDGNLSYFIDTLHQFRAVASRDWNGNTLVDLFALQPNYLAWAWPKWSEGTAKKPSSVLGFDTREATVSLVKAAAKRGIFDPSERVRGRGAWTEGDTLLWHSGHSIWRINGRKLEEAPPGEIGRMFYPRRPSIMEPWPEPVPVDDSPAPEIFEALCTWGFKRKTFDAVLVLGGIAAMLIGGALPFRPHLAFMGDFGHGKTALIKLTKALLDSAMHWAGNTTEAAIRQKLGLDCMPVAVDEFEAGPDNSRVKAIMQLLLISYDGQKLWRGGQDHKGVEFNARSSFLVQGIQLPPMASAERSRMAIIDLGRIDDQRMGEPPTVDADAGRMLLRALMDAWKDFPRVLDNWRSALRAAKLSDRAQNTYGTLFALAELLLGAAALEDAGIPVTEPGRLGELVATATEEERALQLANWRQVVEHLLTVPISVWKDGTARNVGGLLDGFEAGTFDLKNINERLGVAGMKLEEETDAAGNRKRLVLAVPAQSSALAPLFAGTKWQDGGWHGALGQGVEAGVVLAKGKNVKISRAQVWCRLIDLTAYEAWGGAP